MARTLVVLGVGALAVGGLALAAGAAMAAEDERKIWLVRGRRYAIVHRVVGAGWDASMYPGFCNFSNPVITGQNVGRQATFTEVQFTAEWCAGNLQWDVPENIAISEM